VELTSSQKGGVAELKIAAAAADLGIDVYRPMVDGARCDLIFDAGHRLLRIQCKWATLKNHLIVIRLRTSRHTPSRGYVVTTYSASEIDGIAAYCRELDRCYFLPIEEFERRTLRTSVWPRRETASSSVLRWPLITRLGL
jgi:hypothetical protein